MITLKALLEGPRRSARPSRSNAAGAAQIAFRGRPAAHSPDRHRKKRILQRARFIRLRSDRIPDNRSSVVDGRVAPRPRETAGRVATWAYLQPGVSTVWPGGWHLALASLGPPPLLPGPNDGSAIA